VEKPERNRPISRSRRRMEHFLKMGVKNTRKFLDCIYLSQDMDKEQAAVNTVIKLQVLYKMENFLNRRGVTGFSRRTLLHGGTYKNTYHEASKYADSYTVQSFDHSVLSNLRSCMNLCNVLFRRFFLQNHCE
jgi:hypothetical protein